MKQQVNLEIMQFVETQILPKYTEFGESHGLRHVTRVIRNALKLVPVTGADKRELSREKQGRTVGKIL